MNTQQNENLWRSTACILCYVNCGIEVMTEGRNILTGNFGRKGTNNLHTWLQPLWGNSRGERSAVTGQEHIAGLYPQNRFPAEVLSDHPDRLRAVWVDSSNPLNTAANTKAMEEAFRALELVIVVDVALTETAALAHSILPAASQYEKWGYTLFNFEFPTNTFHLRTPLFDPLPGTLPELVPRGSTLPISILTGLSICLPLGSASLTSRKKTCSSPLRLLRATGISPIRIVAPGPRSSTSV